MKKSKSVWMYLLLIVLQAIHVLEELVGNATFIDSVYGGKVNFLFIMSLLLLIPIFLTYAFAVKNKKWAFYLLYVYGAVMVIDGISHIIQKEAGVYSGIGFIIVGILIFANGLLATKNKHES